MPSVKHSVKNHPEVRGQSLAEILIGIGLGAILFLGAAAIIAPTLQITGRSSQAQTEAALTNELLGNVATWAGANWNNIFALATGTLNTYYLNTTQSPYVLGGGSSETVAVGSSTYTRYFYVSDVYRDASGNPTLVAAGNTYDSATKRVTVTVSPVATSTAITLTLSTFLTRTNGASVFSQGDWSGGSGQAGPATTTNNKFWSSAGMLINTAGTLRGAIGGGNGNCGGGGANGGTLDSTTFDTSSTQGAEFNSILWQGTQAAGSIVQFQLAASTSSNGPWNFAGPDGSALTCFAPSAAGKAAALNYNAFNNMRYFRYRVYIGVTGSTSSAVNNIVVNWSP